MNPLISQQGRAIQQHNARTHPANVQAAELIRLYRNEGLTYAAIAERLNRMGFTTRWGKAFLTMSVQRLDGQRPNSKVEQAMSLVQSSLD